MVVQLFLTEEMIDCFHFCAKKADYRQLFNNYPIFFNALVENLEKVEFPDACFYQCIARNSSLLMDILKRWHSRLSLSFEETSAMENELPEFIAHFWKFGAVRDWNDFYMQYKSAADLMITHAVNQKVIDFKIECNGELFGSFLDRDNFLESCIVSNGTEEPQAAPRRRPRIIDNNSRLTQASTPEDSTNEDVLHLEEKKAKVNDKTDKEHSPELAQHLLTTTPVPRPRTRIIDDNNWPTLASTSDIAINNNVSNSKKQSTEKPKETDEDHTAKHENLMQTATDSGAPSKRNSVPTALNSANQHDEEEGPPVPKPRTRIIDDNSLSILASTSDTNNNDDVLHSGEQITRNPEITDRDHEEMESGGNSVKQEMEISITDLTANLLDSERKQEELAEKSREINDINHHQLENRVQEQLKVQEEQMKLREDKLKTREEELDRRLDEIKSLEEHLDKKVDEIRLREEQLGRKMEEMIEMIKLVATKLL